MKVLAILFIAAPIFGVLATTPAELAAKIQAHHQECSKLSKVDSQVLSKARTGQIEESNVALREHIFCFGKKAGLINEAGDLQENVIKTKLGSQVKDAAAVDKVYKLCNATKKGDDKKLFITQVLICYYKNIPAGVVIL
ncbi:hypothetical protein WA026_018226 [Henosepilachna vigintioctopunctata]|uniref:Uncharacterized protein n=1 Tax=Henosepilachna vigintioctopunctata TaxID=420089 RepID=A0AAW1VHV5_9CUCU